MQANVRVHAGQVIGRVDPNLFGHFIEHLGRCVYGGLWAEMLCNRKFSGPDVEEFGVVTPWQSVGRAAGIFLNHDNTTFYTGNQSQKIVARTDPGTPHGVRQGPLALQCGRHYRLRLVVCQQGLRGPLRFALENEAGQPYLEEECLCEEGDWHRHEASLVCPVDDPTGYLAITFRGTGTVWLGAVSLMPEDSLAGWRPDVVQAVRDLRPPLVRWPGGNFASAYHWRDGIGPRDRRPTRLDPVWNALEPNDVGTDEFMALCRILETEPYLAVNVGSGTPEEAAAWVEYCNGPPESAFGRLRAENGHPAPYGVRYWGVGNETYGNWQYGHVDAETYARQCVAFAGAMRAVDPHIKLIAVGAHEYEAPEWNRSVLETAGRHVQYLSLHHYVPGEMPRGIEPTHDELYPVIVAGPERVEELLHQAEEAIAQAGLAGQVSIAFDEWNVWVHAHYECAWEEPYLLRDGLYAASIFNVLYRECRHVTMANLAQLVNVLGAIYTTPTGLFLTPIYLACRLHRDHSGPVSLHTEVDSPTFDARPMGRFMPPRLGARYVDAAATLDEERRTLYLSVVNRHRSEPAEVQVQIEGTSVQLEGAGHDLNGPSALSGNSITNPDVVRVQPITPFLAGNRFTYTFPAHSATVMELRLAE
ncbi:MAG TPA: alpha-L-arabinofuranosidase C-terminal domain-containing protein [Anaerolineae bacterium]|nr:alpha-L-arabinofuranosidase C-terminal domain-containing protein [Anaerolineae bacterium]HOQ97994.1 alpha-L-arabinofuranosidase C-terminal domain-containing protein [Anaerolineae bacterium]HPL26689.1 alpha-L-arabinofuranosidase C-terminal domain-containing protein [Anaerolineae bacterium]